MRRAPGYCCVLLAMVVAGFIPAAQSDQPTNGTGPIYTIEELRAFELYGIHLGMTRDDARMALAAAGLKVRSRYPEGLEEDVTDEGYEMPGRARPGELWTFGVSYTQWAGRDATVSSFGYYWAFPTGDAPDIQQRRADLVKRFGPPSFWRQLPVSKGEMMYSAVYVPLASLVDEQTRDEATSCMRTWECLEGQERADCRKKMESARVPIVTIRLLPQLENYSFSDYEATYAELARAPGFHGQQAEALCATPRAH